MSEERSLSTVETISLQIKKELSNESVSRALLATTFKGLEATSMKQALMEGMIRGFTFQDFLKKDIYAIPFGKGYSLVTSIDNSRKLAMRTGLYCGKTAPIYETEVVGDGETQIEKIISCTITVKKLTGGIVGEFTATVYFDEYTTGRNLWVTKPRTMIAKVAEMHALRMAFPEQLDKQYIEEELQANTDARVIDVKEKVDEGELTMGNFIERGDDKTKREEEKTIQISEEGEDTEGFLNSIDSKKVKGK